MAKNSIRLHKEHGLNPTISQCIICKKGKNEIALLGAKYKGQAPMQMVVDVEPCKKCRARYLTKGKGVMLVNPQTGDLVIIKESAFKKMFNVPVPKGRIAYTEAEVLRRIKPNQF